jgi:hypothetical protein
VDKKRKIYIVTISSAVVLSVLSFIFNPLYYFSQEFGKLDSDLKHILITIIMAGLGGSLFICRNRSKGEFFEQFEAIELLLLIVIPSVEAYTLIMKNPSDYSLAIAVYVIAVMVWFFIVIMKHNQFSNSKKEKLFIIKMSYVLAVLLSFGIFAFWQLNTHNFWIKFAS